MTKRQMPPGRKSKLWVVVVKPFGPHHCARCRASVKAANTSSRGASNTRTPSITLGSLSRSMLLPASFFSSLARFLVLAGFFPLKRPQIFVEPIEPLLPELPIALQPFVDALERLRFDLAGPPLRLTAARDQPGF